jgi:uncharacterized protein (TIGR02145 family)
MKKVLLIAPLIFIVSFLTMTCTKDKSPTLPILSTSTITDITEISAIGGGFISSDGSAAITARGVCWNTTVNPTTSNSKSTDGDGVGQFVSSMNGLTAGTVYHVRAYATNSVGTAYGADIMFYTSGDTPSCITIPATEIYLNSATLNGAIDPHSLSTTVTFEYGTSTSYGQSATASQSPLMGNELVNVSINITGLTLGTTYHFRVKTENPFGTCYGGDMVFTTLSTILTLPTYGLVAYYPFNGNANDESGNGLNGVVNGAILSSDRFGNPNSAYSFTDNQDITVPNSQNQNLYPISISLWYSVTSISGDYHGSGNIFSKYTDASWNGYQITVGDYSNVPNHGILEHNGYGTPSWYLRSTNDRIIGYYGESPFLQQNISLNIWYHYVFIADETGGKIYVNGQLIDSHAWTGTPGACINSNIWKIGGLYSNIWYNGKIDDIRVYNRALSSFEVGQLYSEGGYSSSIVTDIDGNSYNTIKIGTQVWMKENLKTTRYSNGDLIGTTTPATLDISGESTPKYQWAYAGNESNVATYGRLYTWYAVTDSRDICPTGWHVPTDAEWTVLTDYLTNNGYGYQGSGSDIGKSLAATSGWRDDTTPGNVGNDQASNNSSGFTALPGGGRWADGTFHYIGDDGYWYSSTEFPTATVYGRAMTFYSNNVIRRSGQLPTGSGDAVRCLRD